MFRATMLPSSGELFYQCDTCFMSLCVDDRLLCRSIFSCIPDFYFYSLHVSGNHVAIIRRIIVSMRHLVYVTLCRWPSGMQEYMLLHTRRSSTQSDINQVSHWYNNTPDDGHMVAPKHVENRNKHSWKIEHQFDYLQGSYQDTRSKKT